MKKMRAGSIAALFIVGMLLAACSAREVSEDENKVDKAEKIVMLGEVASDKQDKIVDESKESIDGAVEEQTDNMIVITAHEYSYDPEEMIIKKGEMITLTFINEGNIVHDWVIKEIPVEMASHIREGPHDEKQNKSKYHDHSNTGNKEHSHSSNEDDSSNEDHSEHNHEGVALHVSAAPGETNIIEFVAKEAGTYTYFCSIPGHKEQGMLGTIKVE